MEPSEFCCKRAQSLEMGGGSSRVETTCVESSQHVSVSLFCVMKVAL